MTIPQSVPIPDKSESAEERPPRPTPPSDDTERSGHYRILGHLDQPIGYALDVDKLGAEFYEMLDKVAVIWHESDVSQADGYVYLLSECAVRHQPEMTWEEM